jgi:hypothetical protein
MTPWFGLICCIWIRVGQTFFKKIITDLRKIWDICIYDGTMTPITIWMNSKEFNKSDIILRSTIYLTSILSIYFHALFDSGVVQKYADGSSGFSWASAAFGVVCLNGVRLLATTIFKGRLRVASADVLTIFGHLSYLYISFKFIL